MRVIDLALPLLEAGKSLRFALMPQGMDPDDLIRTQGAGAMRAVLESAVPLVQLLWRRETEGRVFDSPERKAALDEVLRKAIRVIPDPGLRDHYGKELKELRWALFGTRRTVPRKGGWKAAPAPYGQALGVTGGAKSSVLGMAGGPQDHLREAVILAVLLVNPALIPEFEAEVERMECGDPDHVVLRDALLRHAGSSDLWAQLAGVVGEASLEKLMAQRHVAIVSAVRRPGDHDTARLCLAEELAKLTARRGHAREVQDALKDLAGVPDEGLTWRLGQAAAALDRAGRGNNEDRTEFETGQNGARMRRDERSAFDDLLGGIDFGKAGKRGA
jgi:DNA primase